jgi:hypothetical protein
MLIIVSDFIDDAEEEFGQESSLLHAEIDVLARVVPVPNETNMSRSEDEAARDIVDRWKRSRFISESTTTESEQLTQTQLRLIDIAKASVGPIDYDMRALRRNRRLEIIDEVNRARRQARRALERAGEEIPPELGTDKDAKCPSGNHEELFSEETYEVRMRYEVTRTGRAHLRPFCREVRPISRTRNGFDRLVVCIGETSLLSSIPRSTANFGLLACDHGQSI